jgi:molybdenum ABC transporter ATP-binding protein
VIAIKNLGVDLGEFQLQEVNLEVEQGEYFIILGPTGAGKTVLLEAIAGLHSILGGEIWVDSREITRLKPEKRGIGIVYQDQALFPHLSVKENIAFGLKLRKYPKKEIETRIETMSELLGISHLLHRKPGTLSGGESQRVALARALVMEPEVLLLDEPLSALDPETRERLQQELERVHHRLDVTILHVTHDFEEAIALGHRVAVLNEGRIVQVGTPQEVLRQPASEFVAHFALSRNIFSGEVVAEEYEHALVDIGGIKLAAITELRGKVHLSLRPEDILISKEPLSSTARNSFQGTVSQISDRGAVIYVTVDVPPDFVCLITRQSFEELELREGGRVWLTFKASAVHIF